MTMKDARKYAKVFAVGFAFSFASYLIVAYFRNEGFEPFRYLFF